jgi:hypothetical protein
MHYRKRLAVLIAVVTVANAAYLQRRGGYFDVRQ